MWSQELPATAIAERFPDVTRPAISQHLAVLKEASLVNERRDGTRRLYRANTDTMAELRAFLDDYWTSGLERLRDVAEAEEARNRPERQELMAELIREIVIDAPPETIWPFLVEPDKHAQWNGTVADIDPQPGGAYRVLMGGESQAAGKYVEVVPQEKVTFTFGWENKGNPIRPGSTTVEITLHPEGDKTRVRLVHPGLPDDAISDHTGGWDHYLARLATAATGGDPGPDTTEQTRRQEVD